MKIKVTIKEVLEREIELEAENEAEAVMTIESMYRQEEIVLDSDDFSSVSIEVKK